MTVRRTLPELANAALRDHASDAVVERVWQRLQPEIRIAPQNRAPALWWAPATAIALFAAGVFVGTQLNAPSPVAILQPEEHAEPTPTPAAEVSRRREPAVAVPRPRQVNRRSIAARRLPPASIPIESAPPVEPPAPAPAPMPSVSASAEPPAWQTLAAQLDYEAAGSALAQDGGFPAALGQASPEQLMTLHDIARATGDRVHALDALRQVVELHADDPNAPVAAWSLGNMLESAGDSLGAAQAYAAYRALSPQGDFAEDALARQVEIIHEQGDLAQAQRMAKQYVQEFSSGRHLEEMQRLSEQAKAGDADREPASATSRVEEAAAAPSSDSPMAE